jgi:hypothetical protein
MTGKASQEIDSFVFLMMMNSRLPPLSSSSLAGLRPRSLIALLSFSAVSFSLIALNSSFIGICHHFILIDRH